MNAPFDTSIAIGPDAASQPAPAYHVAVVGLGYIGLPTAAVLSSAEWNVCGVDISERVVETVRSGKVHIEERDLDSLVSEATTNGRLTAATEMPQAHFYIIAVPTPLGPDNKPDSGFVEQAARAIAARLLPGACIIIESTCPVGSTEKVAEIIRGIRPDLEVPRPGDSGPGDISIAYCPERVLPGNIVRELIENDRVIGGLTPVCAQRATALYRSFVKGACVVTSSRVAETVKLVENSFRDVNIAFANELSMIADEIGVDVWEVIRLANRHPRVNILQPGPGVGGHCIAVDPWFLVDSAPSAARLVRTAREVNNHKAVHTEARIRKLIEGSPDASVALLGIAFKPDIDDFRESPALKIAASIARDWGERIMVVEPYASELPGPLEGTGARLTGLETAVDSADIVVILVDHSAFRHLTLADLAGKTTLDTRGMLDR